ncbi:LysM peptidoglycan-binding domain-containing protein [Paenibacillus oralis]|uniref:LysM peptidoglycan-binding domain-containing protein n=1 Tax=Paenibacillus oralis TaxID=2490856 RepID=A0A3P3TTS5_9BACL|nr:LysM domain-containing protein [Paenibacillus oralis]RRJ61535.1 LysM peptidoglycan-binding domain-containing protein [Paenibacillus oralis]
MKIHIVKKGDTLFELSKKYNVPLQKLIDANPQITNPDVLNVGDKVKIPAEAVPIGGGTGKMYKHVVKQGDTLWKLAKAWGLSLQTLIAANPQLKDPNELTVGEIVNIPAGAGAGPIGDGHGNPNPNPNPENIGTLPAQTGKKSTAPIAGMAGKKSTAPIAGVETPPKANIAPEAVQPEPVPKEAPKEEVPKTLPIQAEQPKTVPMEIKIEVEQIQYETTNLQPVKIEPIMHEPIKYEPPKFEPIHYEPAKYEPIAYTPMKPEPTSLAPISYEPMKPEPTSLAPISYEPMKPEPTSLAPISYEPMKPEPTSLAPISYEPMKTEPTSLAPISYEPMKSEPYSYGPVSPAAYEPMKSEPQAYSPLTAQYPMAEQPEYANPYYPQYQPLQPTSVLPSMVYPTQSPCGCSGTVPYTYQQPESYHPFYQYNVPAEPVSSYNVPSSPQVQAAMGHIPEGEYPGISNANAPMYPMPEVGGITSPAEHMGNPMLNAHHYPSSEPQYVSPESYGMPPYTQGAAWHHGPGYLPYYGSPMPAYPTAVSPLSQAPSMPGYPYPAPFTQGLSMGSEPLKGEVSPLENMQGYLPRDGQTAEIQTDAEPTGTSEAPQTRPAKDVKISGGPDSIKPRKKQSKSSTGGAGKKARSGKHKSSGRRNPWINA